MPDTIVSWLDGVGSTAFTLSAVAFVALNVVAIAAVTNASHAGNNVGEKGEKETAGVGGSN